MLRTSVFKYTAFRCFTSVLRLSFILVCVCFYGQSSKIEYGSQKKPLLQNAHNNTSAKKKGNEYAPYTRSADPGTLYMTSSSSLNIGKDGMLSVKSTITNEGNAANFILESDANLIQINNISNTGFITAKRNVTNLKFIAGNGPTNYKDYVYWSSPVEGQKTKGAEGFSPGTPNNRFYYYLESNDRFYETGDPYFRRGRGYAVQAESTSGLGSPYTKDYNFVGTPNNGDISFSIVKSVNSGAVEHGYNLVGNPYPSNISFDELYAGNNPNGNDPLIYKTAWFWTNASYQEYQAGSGYGGNNYAIYNGTGGNASTSAPEDYTIPNGIIKVGQGFLVQKITPGRGDLNFKNSYSAGHDLRVASVGTFYYKNTGTKNRFTLQLTAPNQIVNSQLIGYMDGATNDYEQDYDAEAFDLSSDLFYSILPGKRLLIQGKSTAFTIDDQVQLGANFFQNGSYTIAINNAEGIFNGSQTIYLKDKQEGIITNLSEGSYTFNASKGDNSTRFEIIYKPEAVLATDTSTKEPLVVYKDGTDFVVFSPLQKISSIEVYDASARLIYKVASDKTEIIIRAEHLTHGMLILKINLQNGKIVNRKVRY